MQRERRETLLHLELPLWGRFLYEKGGGERGKEAGAGGEEKRESV